MIPRRYIEEWKEFAPWPDDSQVEQDLVIERALADLFSDEMIRKNLAFRGGTALHKLFLKPQVRYSEDIDLVQITAEPIGPILKKIRERLGFLGQKRTVKPKKFNNTIIYTFDTEIEPVVKMKLKIEINCIEHFTVLGYQDIKHEVKNSWFQSSNTIVSYQLEELLGTKLRALYQRRKGRDLFDLYWAYQNTKIDTGKLITCYNEYMKKSVPQPPTQKEFLLNMEEKMQDTEFTNDIHVILRPGVEYDNQKAYEFIKTELIEKI